MPHKHTLTRPDEPPWLQLSLSGISSVEQLTATILQRLGLGAGGLVLLYEDADFDEFLALTEMSELPENANVKLVPSVSGAQSLSVGEGPALTAGRACAEGVPS